MNTTTVLELFPQGMKVGVNMAWDAFMIIFNHHWKAFLLLFFVIFFAVIIKAMIGKWGALGSFLYHFFYFGTLFVIGLIWGPEVFINDIFGLACAVILYPLCYIFVGWIINKAGFRRKF